LCEPLHSLHRTAARSIGKGNAFALHSLMDICRIIFIFSDLISKEALILLDTSNHRLFKMEESHNQRNTVASLKQSPSRQLRTTWPTPCAAANMSVAPESASSPATIRCCPKLWPTFYDTENGKWNFTSITGEHPDLSFLPFLIDNIAILDCCNGLILC
jgi:hypothetical protein